MSGHTVRPASRKTLDEAWIAEQMTHFKPGDMDAAVQVIRAKRRTRLGAAIGRAAAA